MKKQILGIFAILSLCLTNVQAQNNVWLKINHTLGAAPFAFNFNTETADGEAVKFRRLEYYISQIVLVHDGGQMTKVKDTWLLVDANSATHVQLGQYAITNLEEIRFGIGVEPTVNHEDPSAYAPSHPLSPKSPSMHWGWEAGYRYIALEGSAGPNRNQNMEIHSLGDVNYKQIKLATSGKLTNNDLTIELLADYQQALAGIVTKDGLIVHADNFEGADLMTNFHTKVFKSGEGNSSALSISKNLPLAAKLYPNPSNGTSTLVLDDISDIQSIVVYNQQGQEVYRIDNPQASVELTAPASGLYFIQAISASTNYTALKWAVNP